MGLPDPAASPYIRCLIRNRPRHTRTTQALPGGSRSQPVAAGSLGEETPALAAKAFCEQRVPAEIRDQVRLEFTVRGNAITIVERRPPWRPDFGPEWSSQKIAQLRYDGAKGTWSLHWRDSRERWHLYSDVKPSRDVAPLLAEIDADPTGIFWG